MQFRVLRDRRVVHARCAVVERVEPPVVRIEQRHVPSVHPRWGADSGRALSAPVEIERGFIVRDRDEPKSTALRITNQFRSGGGMAYDLKCDGVRLTVLITERTR